MFTVLSLISNILLTSNVQKLHVATLRNKDKVGIIFTKNEKSNRNQKWVENQRASAEIDGYNIVNAPNCLL